MRVDVELKYRVRSTVAVAVWMLVWNTVKVDRSYTVLFT